MPEINGVEPPLVGRSPDVLLGQEYWHCGKLKEPAYVSFLSVDSQWHRLYFEYDIVFWRPDADPRR